jgi:apolipoprotein N-acyltransferase
MLNTILWIVGIVLLIYLAVYLLRPAPVAIVFLAVVGSIFGFWPGVIAAGIGFFWMLSEQHKEED